MNISRNIIPVYNEMNKRTKITTFISNVIKLRNMLTDIAIGKSRYNMKLIILIDGVLIKRFTALTPTDPVLYHWHNVDLTERRGHIIKEIINGQS